MILASLIMGFVVYLVYFRIGALLPAGKMIQMGILLLSVLLAIITYFGICYALKIEELNVIISKIKNKVHLL